MYIILFSYLLGLLASGNCRSLLTDEYELNHKIARDSQSMDSFTNPGTKITPKTVELSKEINTVLGSLIFLTIAITYWLLMRYTTKLSDQVSLPSKFLEDNIAAVLSATWPKHFIGSKEETIANRDIPWVLFNIRRTSGLPLSGHSIPASTPTCKALGSHDVEQLSDISDLKEDSFISVQCFSPVMKNLVQIAIWNFFSLWVVLIMIINTLIYNGFFSNNSTNDNIIRLVLIGIYSLANFGHHYYASTLIYRNFTLILFQACWTILCKDFIFLDYNAFLKITFHRDAVFGSDQFVWMTFSVELFGQTERSNTYELLIGNAYKRYSLSSAKTYVKGSKEDHWLNAYLKTEDKSESKLDKVMKPLREAEIKVYEKAIDSTLEKLLANIFILLGICLATTLAPWTSFRTINATVAQLGSYALLISTSRGVLALISSITQLTNATDSAKRFLRYQEKGTEPVSNLDSAFPTEMLQGRR